MRKPFPDHILDRAVYLWCRALAAPLYRNERPGQETRPNVLSSVLAASMPLNNDADTLAKFGQALKHLLLHGTPRRSHDGQPNLIIDTYPSVDYGPCLTLKLAAERAGLKMEFPWKTSMQLGDDSVGFSMGYGAEMLHHYQLPDGRWLVTTLRGSEHDIDKVARLAYADPEGWVIDPPVPAIEAKELP